MARRRHWSLTACRSSRWWSTWSPTRSRRWQTPAGGRRRAHRPGHRRDLVWLTVREDHGAGHHRRGRGRVRAVRHDEGRRHGHGPGDQPVHHRSARRTPRRRGPSPTGTTMRITLPTGGDMITTQPVALCSSSTTTRRCARPSAACCARSGVRVVDLPSAQAFLEHELRAEAGCLVLDVRMPGLSGLELQAALAGSDSAPPIVFITGHGDIPMAVRAMKLGAVEFLPKPFRENDLLDAVSLPPSERDQQTAGGACAAADDPRQLRDAHRTRARGARPDRGRQAQQAGGRGARRERTDREGAPPQHHAQDEPCSSRPGPPPPLSLPVPPTPPPFTIHQLVGHPLLNPGHHSPRWSPSGVLQPATA